MLQLPVVATGGGLGYERTAQAREPLEKLMRGT
jgi:hypothetical protein